MRIPSFALVAAILSPGVCLAGDENLISVGYGEGVPGSQDHYVPVTARHDLPIHGFSLALSYPRSSLRLLEISARGTATEGVGVEFFQQVLDNTLGTAVLGAIFDYRQPLVPLELPPTTAGGQPQLLAWLIFEVIPEASAGELRINLLDGLGKPPISNCFTYRGTTIHPKLQHGSFMVYSPDVLTMESKMAFPGSPVPGSMFIYASHAKPLQGFQIAFSFDSRALDVVLLTINPGESAADFLNRQLRYYFGNTSLGMLVGLTSNEINFFDIKASAVSATETRVAAGVLFEYPFQTGKRLLPPETSSTTKQSIMKFSFVVKSGADQFGEYIPILLDDSLAPGAINNVFIADSESFTPRKVNGSVYFSLGNLTGNAVRFDNLAPVSGAALTLEPGGFKATTLADGTFLFQDLPAGSYVGAVKRSGYHPGRLEADVAGKGETSQAETVFLFAMGSSGKGFRRGFINPDTKIDISDGITLLQNLFQGGANPTCLDSADANDDAKIDISDAIFLFNYLFSAGRPPPPPFVVCGEDPTADPLGCDLFTGCGS